MNADSAAGPKGVEPAGFFALRTPLLPFDEFLRWTEGLSAASSVDDPERLAAAIADDRRVLRERLGRLVARPAVREALFLASPDLFEAIATWEEQPEGDRGRRVERALVKYVSRMCGRATPFGLFAGSGVGRAGAATCLEVSARGFDRRRSRLDAEYLEALADRFASDPSARSEVVFRPNSSLYRSGDRWSYVESLEEGRERRYRLATVEDSLHLRDSLVRAGVGVTLPELAASLVADDVTRSEADAFVQQLADEQLLVPELGPCLTGAPPPGRLVAGLRQLPGGVEAADALEVVERELEALDAAGAGRDADSYRALTKRLTAIHPPADLHGLFQVDVVTAGRATLGPEVLDELARYAELARKLLPVERPSLTAFREAFVERYGEAEIPLVEALDAEAGIGFPAFENEEHSGEPLLENLPFPTPPGVERLPWGKRERLLLRKASEAWSRGDVEVVLSDEDVAGLSTDEISPLPDSFSVVGAVAASSGEALSRGDFRLVLTGLDGPPGVRLLGRFCHADPDLRLVVEEHLRREEAFGPDAVYAEVVHLPATRAGNVLYRPVLRGWEIPFLGASGAAPERQIPVSDLLVSVRGDEIRLRSRRLGRRVVPRLTAAHAYFRTSLAVYHFLGELQNQGVAVGCPFGWGPLADAPFLPRVRYGRLVLSAARWKVDADETRAIGRLSGAERFRALTEWRRLRFVPRFVVLSQGERELPIDLEADLSIDVLFQLAADGDPVELVELLPGPDEMCARGPEGRYVHELVVPFLRSHAPRDATATSVGPTESGVSEEKSRATTGPAAVPRSFLPGSEWLTAKVYCGAATVDRILVERLGPLVRQLLSEGAVRSWFFLRYADPRHHLRLRLHGDARTLGGEAIPRLREALDPARSSGQVWKVQLDTYDREIERYGGPEAIALAEDFFSADSDAVLALLEMLEAGSRGAEERWRLALRGTDALLADLCLGEGARHLLARRLSAAFRREHHADAALSRALGARFRPLARELDRLLDPAHDAGSPLEPGFEAFRDRSRRVEPLVDRLNVLEREGRLTQSVPELAASFAHMFLNRLFRSSARRQELVIYDFLARLYESRAARRSTT